MELDYTPYAFAPNLKIPLEIGNRLRPFCEYKSLRDDINENLYLKILCSISLSLLDKHRVLKEMHALNSFQIYRLNDVFQDEIQKFNKLYEKEKEQRSILTLILRMLLDTIILLRIYQVFEPTEEKVIFKKIFSEWLKGDEKQMIYKIIQHDTHLLKYLYKYCHS